jgi:hypothetical protein
MYAVGRYCRAIGYRVTPARRRVQDGLTALDIAVLQFESSRDTACAEALREWASRDPSEKVRFRVRMIPSAAVLFRAAQTAAGIVCCCVPRVHVVCCVSVAARLFV